MSIQVCLPLVVHLSIKLQTLSLGFEKRLMGRLGCQLLNISETGINNLTKQMDLKCTPQIRKDTNHSRRTPTWLMSSAKEVLKGKKALFK